MPINPDIANRYLSYDPDTGEVRWKECRTRNGKAKVGDVAGCVDEHGYIRLMLDGRKVRAHRVAFVLMGEAEPLQVDHINGNRTDNRWANLRRSDPLQNAKNAKRRKDSTTAVTGVGFSRQHNKWKVRVNHKGVTHYLGLFEDVNAAIAARLSWQRDFGYSERHGSGY